MMLADGANVDEVDGVEELFFECGVDVGVLSPFAGVFGVDAYNFVDVGGGRIDG
jgi:hypothetical protein